MIKSGLPVLLALAALVGGPARAQTKLDTTQFVVVGEGLAAGMADFKLRDVYQDKSFGAQMDRVGHGMQRTQRASRKNQCGRLGDNRVPSASFRRIRIDARHQPRHA